MLFQSGQLFFCILLFITVFVVCKWVFRKGWLNNVVLLLGNALVLANIVRPQSVLILLMLAAILIAALVFYMLLFHQNGDISCLYTGF